MFTLPIARDTQTRENDKQYESLEMDFISAIGDNNSAEIERILQTQCLNPFNAYKMENFQPSQTSLSEAFHEDNMKLVSRLMNKPYSVHPDEACLAYAIMNHRHKVIQMMLDNYHFEVSEAPLQYAVTACNLEMIDYLVHQRQVPIDPELFEHIGEKRQGRDPFPLSERLRRNRRIRRMLCKVFDEEGIEY